MLKLGRFIRGKEVIYGLVEEGLVRVVADPFTSLSSTGKVYRPDELVILAPCLPGKAVCVGLNYRSHAQEMGLALPEEPVLFMKPSSALIGHGDPIKYPDMSQRVDYEAELAVVIGSRCKNAGAGEALRYVLGYTCANDVTARDLQKKDGQWTRAKSFDTFLPLGPYIITGINLSQNMAAQRFHYIIFPLY